MAPPASAEEGPISGTPVHFSTPSSPPLSASENPCPRPSRKVSRFRDEYCMVLPYCRTFKFEYNPDFDYKHDIDTDDEEDTNDVANPIETLIKYVAQIRKSFGFDVDCVAPSWFGGIFVPFDLEEAKLEYPEYYARIIQAADVAMAEINSDLSGSGKSYELVKIEKLVRVKPWRRLFTFRVKEVAAAACDDDTKIIQAIVYEEIGHSDSYVLMQWRFKPVEEDAWYQPPPLEERFPWLKSKHEPEPQPEAETPLDDVAKDA